MLGILSPDEPKPIRSNKPDGPRSRYAVLTGETRTSLLYYTEKDKEDDE